MSKGHWQIHALRNDGAVDISYHGAGKASMRFAECIADDDYQAARLLNPGGVLTAEFDRCPPSLLNKDGSNAKR
jgi:hypothetical protein